MTGRGGVGGQNENRMRNGCSKGNSTPSRRAKAGRRLIQKSQRREYGVQDAGKVTGIGQPIQDGGERNGMSPADWVQILPFYVT